MRKRTGDRGRGRRRRRRKRKKVSARTRIDSTEVGGSRLWKWNPRHSRPFLVVTKLESQGRQVVIGRSSSNTGSSSLKIARFVCENPIHGFHSPSPPYFFSSSDQTNHHRTRILRVWHDVDVKYSRGKSVIAVGGLHTEMVPFASDFNFHRGSSRLGVTRSSWLPVF